MMKNSPCQATSLIRNAWAFSPIHKSNRHNGFSNEGKLSRCIRWRTPSKPVAMSNTMGRWKVTAVGFEPTPLRTGAWSQRLRPLGQTVHASNKSLVFINFRTSVRFEILCLFRELQTTTLPHKGLASKQRQCCSCCIKIMDSQLDLTRLTSRASYNFGEGELRVMLRKNSRSWVSTCNK